MSSINLAASQDSEENVLQQLEVLFDNENDNKDNFDTNLIPSSSSPGGNFDINCAALESRLDPCALSSLEEKYFKNVNIEDYLLLRNCILKYWLDDSFNRLDIKHVQKKLKLTDQAKTSLTSKIFKFLERYGYINYGVFTNNLLHKCLNYTNHRYKIIVIGAGISGIIAARQLTYLGFDVFIVEASKRIGGRLYSFYKNGILIDLGSSFISGIRGNPLRTIIKQLHKNAKKLHPKHKLYLDGEPVDKKKDLVIQNLFLLFIKFVYYFSLKKNINEVNTKQLSPENLFDMFMYCLEVTAATKTLERFKKIFHIEENINIVMDKLKIEFSEFLKNADCFRSTCDESNLEEDNDEQCDKDYSDIDFSDNFDDSVLEKTRFSQILQSHMAFFKSVDLEEEYFNILGKFSELGKNDKFKDALEFFSLEDKRIIEWYFSTLEYFLGAPLSKFSLKAFAENNLENCNLQYFCSDSYMSVLTALFKVDYNLKVQKKTAVKTIRLFEDRVEIQATKNSETKTFVADAVVCTLPLGVLKKSISDDTESNKIKFIPPLPERKVNSIQRLGFGTVNKVVLCFDEKFWQSNDNYLGNVGLSRECRGEFVFYFNLHEQPTITAIICGDSIGTMDITDDVLIVSKCYNTLKEIFENVPVPTMHTVSRWHQNPLFLGTHSYPSTESSLDDFDVLSEPVSFSEKLPPRLFFAGEHTNRSYPATVHGAFISGLRVVAEVANRFDKLNLSD